MSRKIIALNPNAIARVRRRHRVHFGGSSIHATAARGYLRPVPDVVDDDAWTLPPGFEPHDPQLSVLSETVRELVESMTEAQHEVVLAERQRDEAIAATLEANTERDSVAAERDFLATAHRDITEELREAHEEIDTFRAALDDVSHTLRKSNANVRRLYDDIAAIRRDVRQIAASPWAAVVRTRLLDAIKE